MAGRPLKTTEQVTYLLGFNYEFTKIYRNIELLLEWEPLTFSPLLADLPQLKTKLQQALEKC